MNDTKRVTAIFNDRALAKNSLEKLNLMGVDNDRISMLVAENSWQSKDLKIEENTKAPEGAAVGAGVGATATAIIAGLTSVGTVAATGGLGLLATGPLVAAFAGAGAGGTVGGIVGGLIGYGIPETEAKLVDEKLGRGDVLIGVEVSSDNAESVKSMFEEKNANSVTVH